MGCFINTSKSVVYHVGGLAARGTESGVLLCLDKLYENGYFYALTTFIVLARYIHSSPASLYR